MINRVKHLTDHPPEPGRQTEYYEVETNDYRYIVTFEGALEILRQLDELPMPTWIAFRDMFGSRQYIVAAHLTRIGESTLATRNARRAFVRDREKEDEENDDNGNPWDCR